MFVKRGSTRTSVFCVILDIVKPVWLGSQLVVKNSWTPFRRAGEQDRWKFIKLLLPVGCHGNLQQSIVDVNGQGTVVEGANMLSTSDLERSVMDSVAFVPLNLSGRVDGPSLPMACVLPEHANHITMLCEDLCTCIDDLQMIDLVVIDSCDIHHLSWTCVKCVGIISCDASICPPVH